MIPNIVMAVLGSVILLILVSIVLVCVKYLYKRLPKVLKNLLLKVKGKLMWSSLLRFITQSYLDWAITTFVYLFRFSDLDL